MGGTTGPPSGHLLRESCLKGTRETGLAPALWQPWGWGPNTSTCAPFPAPGEAGV